MSELVKDHPKILSSGDLLKLSRSVSYMTFILKEIYEYTTAKLGDETPIFGIRKSYNDLVAMKDKLNHLKSLC
jgi:hypothetical protein